MNFGLRKTRVVGKRARLRVWAALCLGSSLLLSGCQSLNISASTSEAAQIRFVDTSIDAPGLDLYLNGTGAAFNLSFSTSTSYVPLAPGSYDIAAQRSKSGQALAITHAALAAGRNYTALVTHPLSGLAQVLYEDQSVAAAPGTVALRVLDEAALPIAVDIYVSSVHSTPSGAGHSLIVAGLRAGGNSGYISLPAATNLLVTVVPAGSMPTASTSPLGSTTVLASSGAVRTVVLADSQQKPGKAVYAFALTDLDPS